MKRKNSQKATFNFSISPPREPHQMVRVERIAKGKLNIIGRIEDHGGFNLDEQIARISELREKKLSHISQNTNAKPKTLGRKKATPT